MKRNFILTSAAVITAALVFTSCQTSRVWATKKKESKEYRERDYDDNYRYSTPPPPPQPTRYYPSVSLIIAPTPGFAMRENPDGRFYHRTPQGLLYWKGFDNRFYLDQAELRHVTYTRWDYDAWKKYYRHTR